MNAPFYGPEDIDWQDALNPLAIPAAREQRNPYVYRSLQHPTMLALRSAPGYRLALHAVPAPQFATLAAVTTYDATAHVLPGSWLTGISAASQQPEGFRVQISHGTTHAEMFPHAQILDRELKAKPYYLPKPQGIPPPYVLTLRLRNLSTNPNAVQVVLWLAEPDQLND